MIKVIAFDLVGVLVKEKNIQLTEQEQMQYELEMQNSKEDVVDYSFNK